MKKQSSLSKAEMKKVLGGAAMAVHCYLFCDDVYYQSVSTCKILLPDDPSCRVFSCKCIDE